MRVDSPAELSKPARSTAAAADGRSGLARRFGWEGLRYPVAPSANRLPYMLGGLTFSGIVLLIATGVILDQFYNPSASGAHDSVVYIVTRVPLGNWIRALHYWAASIVLIGATAHLTYVFLRRSYSPPREVQWWSGVCLLILLFGLTFTGTVLKADQEGGEALAHALAGAKLMGPAGIVLAPDFARSTTLLARLHNMHVSLLPLLLLALIGVHFWLIRVLGIHTTEPKTDVFTSHLRKLSGYGLFVVAGIVLLAALFPPGIGYPAVDGVEITKPFWPFLWIYTAENTLGIVGMLIAPTLLFAFLIALPLVDRGGDAAPRPRWVAALAGIILVVFLGALIYGVFAPQMQHLGM
jgi:ubiquinol-cytochrome c reductase cytochrome b subunit